MQCYFCTLMSLCHMSHVDFKKYPCCHVQFKGQEPLHSPGTPDLLIRPAHTRSKVSLRAAQVSTLQQRIAQSETHDIGNTEEAV